MTPKQPIVRTGQGKAYRKGTRGQIEHRIESAALLLFLRLSKSEIHRVFREFCGIEWRQTDRYMALARSRDGVKRKPFTFDLRIKFLLSSLKRNKLRI
jgi:hypothetical protein